MTTKQQHWSSVAISAATEAAAKAGVSIEGVRIEYGTIDRTWGDKDGLIVTGGDEALRERVATFLSAWCFANLRKLLTSSYDQQVHPMSPKPFREGLAVGCVYYPCAE